MCYKNIPRPSSSRSSPSRGDRWAQQWDRKSHATGSPRGACQRLGWDPVSSLCYLALLLPLFAPWLTPSQKLDGCPPELATQSQSDPGVPSCRGRAAGGPGVPAARPSPACPTPVLVLGPGSPSAVRALGLMPWPLGPSAAPAPYQGGPGDWGWETPFKQLSRKAGVLKTRVCCS